MDLFRSVIFVPGNRPNMLERARTFKANIIMIDLEDSVPGAEKVHARVLDVTLKVDTKWGSTWGDME